MKTFDNAFDIFRNKANGSWLVDLLEVHRFAIMDISMRSLL